MIAETKLWLLLKEQKKTKKKKAYVGLYLISQDT